jgi:hypothetical protein
MEWQPIETVPKDGQTVLAYVPARKGFVSRQDVIPVHWSSWGGGVWENSTSGGKVNDNPSHWMPLPEPPR